MIMLLQYRWNEDRLMEKYMDSPDDVLREIGEPANAVPSSPVFPPAKRARLSTPEEFTCGICYDTPPREDASTLRCTHQFCNACWNAHLTQKIKGEGSVLMPCMAEGCRTQVGDAFIRKLDLTLYDR